MTPSNQDREIIACDVILDNQHKVILVLRIAQRFRFLCQITGQEAAIINDPLTLQRLANLFNLPTRILTNQEGTLLAMKTLLAKRKGQVFWQPQKHLHNLKNRHP